MSSRRTERVSHSIREVIAELLLREVKDPRVATVTISAVEVSPDLRYAKVLFTCLGEPGRQESARRGLESAGGLLRSQIAKRLQLRYAPELRFAADESYEHAEHIASLLREPDAGE
jgi:ribosome-binding factor A